MTTTIYNANNVTFDIPGGYLASTVFGIAAVLKFKHDLMALAGPHDANDAGPTVAAADILHFQAHRDHPDQIPISTEIVLEFVGVAMTFIPDLFH